MDAPTNQFQISWHFPILSLISSGIVIFIFSQQGHAFSQWQHQWALASVGSALCLKPTFLSVISWGCSTKFCWYVTIFETYCALGTKKSPCYIAILSQFKNLLVCDNFSHTLGTKKSPCYIAILSQLKFLLVYDNFVTNWGQNNHLATICPTDIGPTSRPNISS